ncbi:ABC transporter permease [Propionivibrio soli]|uniref:ABC transporter permease n=1 Tax=Propionivibrio soli TaxID=2976531 RepID=UPI0021E8AAB2|nr:ABC transporter permease [Propionivibrio soli]
MSKSTHDVSNEVVVRTIVRKRLTLRSLVREEKFLYVVSLVVFFTIWHLAATRGNGDSALVTPWATLQGLYDMMSSPLGGETLVGHTWNSLRRVLIGFSIAVCFGIPLGLLLGISETASAILRPLVDVFRPMPPLAWISLSILWFGIGEEPKIFIIFLASFIPSVLNAYNGVRLIEPELYDVVRVMGGSRWDEIKQVVVPASMPAISAGLQLSITSAWMGVLAAELVSSNSGLGYIIILGMQNSDPQMVLGGMVMIAAVAWVLTASMEKIDMMLCPWRREIKGL